MDKPGKRQGHLRSRPAGPAAEVNAGRPARHSIQVIERMMRLMDALAGSSEPVALRHLAAATRLHPSTTHRILNVMVAERVAERVEPGCYRLGMRLLELGNLVKSRISVRELALPQMRALQEATGETVNLSVRRGDDIVYVERASGNQSMMRVVQLDGARAPLHITAAGKLFLADEGIYAAAAYARRTGLKSYTRNSLATLSALKRELEQVAKSGHAKDDEEAEMGVRCIAAPIRDDSNKMVASLSVSAPAERMQPAWADKIAATAREISRSLGYRENR
jgi:IclR family transcriptional regulator, carbohydrate utilization repressor